MPPKEEQICENYCEFTKTLIYINRFCCIFLMTAFLSLIHVQRDLGPLYENTFSNVFYVCEAKKKIKYKK